jgi:hypothetical protein
MCPLVCSVLVGRLCVDNLRVLWVIDCACKLGFMLSKNS